MGKSNTSNIVNTNKILTYQKSMIVCLKFWLHNIFSMPSSLKMYNTKGTERIVPAMLNEAKIIFHQISALDTS